MKKLILGLILFCTPLFSGCIAFYSYEEYDVKVVDAESNIPVGNAEIDVVYNYIAILLNPPERIEVKTYQDGSSTFRVADIAPTSWRLKADGYLPLDARGFRVPEIFKIENGSNVFIPMYKEPKPTIEIVVPDGYRGPVALHFIPTNEWIQEEAGKRSFSYKILPNGYLPIQASALFYEPFTLNYTARYENGQNISSSFDRLPGTRLRWVTGDWYKNLYIIGTEEERDDLENTIWVKISDKEGCTGRVKDNDIFNSYFQDNTSALQK